MRQYNPNKKIKVEIIQINMPAEGYEIWDGKQCITRKASEDDVFDMLSESEYRQFQNGRYIFTVSATQLLDKFSFLYA
jgi:hypothetical protein